VPKDRPTEDDDGQKAQRRPLRLSDLNIPTFALSTFQLNVAPSVLVTFAAAAKQLQDVQRNFALGFNSLEFQAWQTSVVSHWTGIAESALAWGKAYDKARHVLIPHGWLVSPSLGASLAPTLLRAVEEHGEEVIDDLMMGYLSPAALAEILESLFDRPSFAAFRPVFKKALDAHLAGNPELSIPIWLLAIDGICAAELDVQDVFSKLNRASTKNRLKANLDGGRPESSIIEGASEAVITIIADLGRPRSSRAKPSRAGRLLPRRHDILHGSVPEIGDDTYSARCILLLEHLHFCLEHSKADRPHHGRRRTTARGK